MENWAPSTNVTFFVKPFKKGHGSSEFENYGVLCNQVKMCRSKLQNCHLIVNEVVQNCRENQI